MTDDCLEDEGRLLSLYAHQQRDTLDGDGGWKATLCTWRASCESDRWAVREIASGASRAMAASSLVAAGVWDRWALTRTSVQYLRSLLESSESHSPYRTAIIARRHRFVDLYMLAVAQRPLASRCQVGPPLPGPRTVPLPAADDFGESNLLSMLVIPIRRPPIIACSPTPDLCAGPPRKVILYFVDDQHPTCSLDLKNGKAAAPRVRRPHKLAPLGFGMFPNTLEPLNPFGSRLVGVPYGVRLSVRLYRRKKELRTGKGAPALGFRTAIRTIGPNWSGRIECPFADDENAGIAS